MAIETCLLDLDGTLTDPKAGITGCIQHALKILGQHVPSKEELEWCIGPPLYETFLQLLDQKPDQASKALKYYRQRFGAVGLFENKLYPGILDSLSKFKKAGLRLFIATSKPHFYAKQIAAHFKFDHYFEHIHGSEMSGARVHKTELIQYILQVETIDPRTSVMIGDRKHDILGAKANGLQTIGVLYGYGSRAELIEAGTDELAESPAEIAGLII